MTEPVEKPQEFEPPSPYMKVFSDIEALAQKGELSPQYAYETYCAYLNEHNLDPRIYLSMSITSGGFARDPSLDFGDIIGQNSAFGSKIKQSLLNEYPELSDQDIVLPSELGKVKGWSQADFLLFWFDVITGMSPEDAARVSESMCDVMNLPGFTNKDLPSDVRWADYELFTEAYIASIKQIISERGVDFAPNNMASVIIILDGAMSLGGRAEELLSRRLGIPVGEPVIAAESFRKERFFDMTESLLKMGAGALTITNLPYLPKYFEGAIIQRPPYYADAHAIREQGGFRKTGLATVLYSRDARR